MLQRGRGLVGEVGPRHGMAVGIAVGARLGTVAIHGWRRPVVARGKGTRRQRRLLNDADVDNHVAAEVLVARNHGVAGLVLEADALGACWARVQAVEVLDCGDDGVGGIMGVDLHTHGQARRSMRRVRRDQLEADGLGLDRRRRCWRRSHGRRGLCGVEGVGVVHGDSGEGIVGRGYLVLGSVFLALLTPLCSTFPFVPRVVSGYFSRFRTA